MGIFSYLAVSQPEQMATTREFRFFYFTDRYDETVAFYRDGLGLEIYNSWDRAPMDKGTIFRFPETGGLIEIEKGTSSPQLGGGLYFEVSDVWNWHGRLAETGVAVSGDPAMQSYGHINFSLQDPNGLILTIFQKA